MGGFFNGRERFMWMFVSVVAITLLTVSLCAEEGKFKKNLTRAAWIALALQWGLWIFCP